MNNPNTSSSEQKAEQLWARYSRKDNQYFWQAYEALLEQKTKIVRSAPVYKSRKHYLTPFILLIIPFLLWTVLATFLWLPVSFIFFAAYEEISLQLLMLLAGAVMFTTFSLGTFHKMFAYFVVDKSGIYIKGGFFNKTRCFIWHTIENVKVEANFTTYKKQAIETYSLCIEMLDGEIYKIKDYNLSQTNHHSFVQKIERRDKVYLYKGSKNGIYSPQSMQKYLSTKRN